MSSPIFQQLLSCLELSTSSHPALWEPGRGPALRGCSSSKRLELTCMAQVCSVRKCHHSTWTSWSYSPPTIHPPPTDVLETATFKHPLALQQVPEGRNQAGFLNSVILKERSRLPCPKEHPPNWVFPWIISVKACTFLEARETMWNPVAL